MAANFGITSEFVQNTELVTQLTMKAMAILVFGLPCLMVVSYMIYLIVSTTCRMLGWFYIYLFCKKVDTASATLLDILEGNCNEELSEELVEVSRPRLVTGERTESMIKRRIKSGNKAPYTREIVAAVKAKFGTPKRTEANLRAVRRYATEVMRENNLRHTNIQQILPIIIAAAFVPDKYEILGMELASCEIALERQSEFEELRRIAGFNDS